VVGFADVTPVGLAEALAVGLVVAFVVGFAVGFAVALTLVFTVGFGVGFLVAAPALGADAMRQSVSATAIFLSLVPI
jgi:hypothetical protein